jgi:hypothetical protein
VWIVRLLGTIAVFPLIPARSDLRIRPAFRLAAGRLATLPAISLNTDDGGDR